MTALADEPIGLAVTRTAKALGAAFDAALTQHGGSMPTWLVLTSVTGGLHASQRAIADAVGVEGPTLTHHLNRLEADGLVTRQRSAQNRRVHQVELTEAGRARFVVLLGAVQRFDARLRAGLSDDELDTLRRLLRRLAANAASTDPDPHNGPRCRL